MLRNEVKWCTWEGKRPSQAGPVPSVEKVASGSAFANPKMLSFRDPLSFTAGNLSACASSWETVLEGNPKRDELWSYIAEGVDVFQFFAPFDGRFQGKPYRSNSPPKARFPNAASCKGFDSFITHTIKDRVRNGSLRIVGKAGYCEPPHLVLPLTVEPNKPRLCHDERFLNCWIKDSPLKLDYITDLIRYVGPNHLQTTFDDKSGYDHVRLHPRSFTFFGIEWKGWYFTYTTLPFGWKASAYIYHTIGMAATSYIRSLGVPCSQYIDDRHVGQLQLPSRHHNPNFSHSQLANMAAFITCSVLISLGYFIGLTKSCFEPSTEVRFLGYICDSTLQAFILPEDKKVKFAKLRGEILKNNSVSLKNLQKFAGKTTSFALVVPAAKLYTNTAYQAIAKANRSRTTKIPISEHLRREISHWAFLDSWKGSLPWKSEVHRLVKMYTDASNTGWGGILLRENADQTEMRGYWDVSERHLPISTKESLALLRVLENLPVECSNARLDVLSDSKVLIGSWERQVSACETSSDILKRIFEVSSAKNLDINLFFVPSKENLADEPSRVMSDLDATLARDAWLRIDHSFGPHTIDLMALPSNVMQDRSGRPLRFFSPTPCNKAAGTNVFAQAVPPYENPYVFPPFVLIGPLLRFLFQQRCSFTIVVPDLYPKRFWWPIVSRAACASFRLGCKGDRSTLLFPSRSLQETWEARPLPWDLWAFRVNHA